MKRTLTWLVLITVVAIVVVVLQYVDGKPAVIEAGPDGIVGTTDDIIVHYEIE